MEMSDVDSPHHFAYIWGEPLQMGILELMKLSLFLAKVVNFVLDACIFLQYCKMVYTDTSSDCRPRDVSHPIPCENEEYQYQYQWLTADVERVFCMEGGEGEESYARNSEAPASAISLSLPFLKRAIHTMPFPLLPPPSPFSIADLGCATGPNTTFTVDFVVDKLKREYHVNTLPCPEFEAFFCDLPLNDFNTLFRSLPPLEDSVRRKSRGIVNGNGKSRCYYAAGVPGSFYDRLFPTGKLHIAISLSALHWMSRIPECVIDKNSLAYNRGRAWIDGAPKEVVKAYAKQSEEDLKSFLHCRAEEMASGALLFLLMAGRPDNKKPQRQLGDPITKAKHPFTQCMDNAWNDLLNEGLIDEETRDTFNIPAYMRSREEIRQAFDECNAFDVKCIEFRRVMEHSEIKQEQYMRDPLSYAKTKANLVRATMRPIIHAHLRSSSLTDTFFNMFEKRATHDETLLNKICYYGIIIVFAIRK